MYLGRENIYGLFEKQLLEVDQPGVPQTVYTLLWSVGSTTSVIVVSDGQILEPGPDFEIQDKTITFAVAPDPTKRTYVIFLARELATPRIVGIEPILDRFVGDALGTTDFVLSRIPVNGASLIVFVDGVQKKMDDDFSLSGSTLQFFVAPADGADISVYIHGVQRFDTYSIVDIPAGGITDFHLANDSVTTPKIADGAVTHEKIGFTWLDYTQTVLDQIETFGGMTLAVDYPRVNRASYRHKWNNTVEVQLDFVCKFEGVPNNIVRYPIPVYSLENDVSPLGIVQVETSSLLELGQQHWGASGSVDILRQNGINYTLNTEWRFRVKFEYEYITSL